jgi:hypothetical protein
MYPAKVERVGEASRFALFRLPPLHVDTSKQSARAAQEAQRPVQVIKVLTRCKSSFLASKQLEKSGSEKSPLDQLARQITS